MYDIPKNEIIESKSFFFSSLIHLAAMKAHAIWQRSKRKDYVDMYFLIKKFWIKEIIKYTKTFLWNEFNPKLFLSQLSFFDDINYDEQVERMPWFETDEKTIKDFLEQEAVNI